MKIVINDFFKGILSLVISQVFIKIFGLAYSLYMTNKSGFGDAGNAIYMSGYQIYALLLTISSIGVPSAISKMISEKKSIEDNVNKDRVFKISLYIFSLIGCLGSITLYIFSGMISKKIIQIPEAELSLKVLSPAVFFVSIASVLRGFYNGENKIYITAKSQIYEQILKSVLTILFVEITSKISNYNTEAMAAVANMATTIATFLSLIYLLLNYTNCNTRSISIHMFPKERIIHILKNVLKISIPITISAILTSLGKNVDSITVVRILKNIIGEEQAIIKYGILSSKIDILIALPLSFNIAISTALIPEISRRKAKNDIDGIIKKIQFSLLITIIIGIPCTFGMYFYSEKILNLLFPNANSGAQLLSLSAISIIFALLIQTIIGIMQGLGKNKIPLYVSIVGIILKIVCNIILIPIDNIYEKGAVIGNIVSNVVSFIILYYYLRKNIKLNFSIFKLTLKPILASIIMIFVSINIYNILINCIKEWICTIIAICSAIIVYVLFSVICNDIKIYKD